MMKHILTAGAITVGVVAIISAQAPAQPATGSRRSNPGAKPLPSAQIFDGKTPVKEIPKARGKWRTPWGDPDLQWIWNNGTATPLQRPEQFGTREYMTPEEVAAAKVAAATRAEGESEEQRAQGLGAGPTFWYDVHEPDTRTSLIYDPPNGRTPPPAPEWAAQQQERARLFKEPRYDKSIWERQGAWVRCISRGQPAAMNPVVYNNNYQIIQTPGYVVIHQEMVHVSRIIPLDKRPHVDPKIRMWEGDARGWFEGETLVVETTNFHPEAEPIDRQPHISGKDYKLIQKFTRVTDSDIDYRYTLDAPTVYTAPFSAAIPMSKHSAANRITEYACIEGDNSVRLTITGLVRQATDPEYAARVRAEQANAPARGGRRGGGAPAGAPPAAPPGRGAGGGQ
jgi:hypothetical protein